MAGFVAVPVASFIEHRVELGLKLLLAAKHLYESFDILGHVPCIVAGGSLSDEGLAVDEIGIILKASTVSLFA